MTDRIFDGGDTGREIAGASPAISLRDVSKEFKLRRGESLLAVSGVSFDVAAFSTSHSGLSTRCRAGR